MKCCNVYSRDGEKNIYTQPLLNSCSEQGKAILLYSALIRASNSLIVIVSAAKTEQISGEVQIV